MAANGKKTVAELKAEVQGVAGLSGLNDANLAVSTKVQNLQRLVSAIRNLIR